MSNREQVAQAAADGLEKFLPESGQVKTMVGFDGFVDSIIELVDQRLSTDEYEPMHTIDQFARKIAAAAGQSSNFELIVKQMKLGGNGPIMANALRTLGLGVTYIGGLGKPKIHSVFEEFADGCEECLSLAEPAYTDAYEFSDGKLMMGKHENTRAINADAMRNDIGSDKMVDIVQRSRLIGMVNWTMLLNTDEIWQYLIDEVFPKVDWQKAGETFMFIDLADPEKRSRESVRNAIQTLEKLQQFTKVVLGLNFKEAQQIADVLGLATTADTHVGIEDLATDIRNATDLHCVVVHPRAGAAACLRQSDGNAETAAFQGPYVQKPKLSTGAGDNFNAGFCLGLMAGLELRQAICTGTGVSGYYVRNAQSPTLTQLIDFCRHMPSPEPG